MTKPGANVEAVAALWAQGLSTPVIAARLGLTSDTVRHIARRHRGLCPARKPGRRDGPSAEVIDRAARMWAQGFSTREIGNALGLTKNAIIGLAGRKRERFPMRRDATRGEAAPAPVRPMTIGPTTRIGRVSLPAMSWDRREPERASPPA